MAMRVTELLDLFLKKHSSEHNELLILHLFRILDVTILSKLLSR